jgi:hypothetical protein
VASRYEKRSLKIAVQGRRYANRMLVVTLVLMAVGPHAQSVSELRVPELELRLQGDQIPVKFPLKYASGT